MKGRTRASQPLTDYQEEVLKGVLEKIPKDSLLTGTWKVFQRRPGRHGGTLESYCGPMEFTEAADLEDEILGKFVPNYGGGEYILKLMDSERRRVEQVPPVRVVIPGDPINSTGTVVTADPIEAQMKQEESRVKLATLQQQRAYMEAQIQKLGEGGQGDPIKVAMAELLRSKIKGDDDGKSVGSPRELLELAMVMKAIREPDPAPAAQPQSSNLEKVLETMASGFGALMTNSIQMQQAQMQSMSTVMGQSMQMIQMTQHLGNQDPWIVALQMAPDLLDRLARIVVEVKQSFTEIGSAQAGNALERLGNGNPQPRPALPAPSRPPAPGPGGPSGTPAGSGQGGNGKPEHNQFLVVVYNNYKHHVPTDTTADQVQYYLSEQQLAGILGAAPDQVIATLEAEGLKRFFDADPQLRSYVHQTILELHKIYHEAAAASEEPSKKEPANEPAAK